MSDLLVTFQSLLLACCSVAISVGLMASPTACACGADVQHPHALLILGGHHHNSSGHHIRLGRAANPVPLIGTAIVEHSPQVQSPSGQASSRIAMLALLLGGLTIAWRRITARYPTFWVPSSWQIRPALPPPRLPHPSAS